MKKGLGALTLCWVPVMYGRSNKDPQIFKLKSRYKVINGWKSTEWPQTDLEHLTVISTLQALKTFLWHWNFCPFCSTATGFRDIRLPKNRKWNDPMWTWTLNSQQYSITLSTYPWGRNFGPFCSTSSRFEDTCTKSPKIGNAPNAPKLNLNT